jgi:hypothetical protein
MNGAQTGLPAGSARQAKALTGRSLRARVFSNAGSARQAADAGRAKRTFMRQATPARLAAGAALALAASVALPAGALAAPVAASKVPAALSSVIVAGYQQEGCRHNGYPVYVEIAGTITVPAATDINGTPGISSDVYSFGGLGVGVSAGVAVDNSNGQAFYTAFGTWDRVPATAFSVEPGDELHVTIEDEGSAGYLVEIFDENSGQEWVQVNPDPAANQCEAAAYEESDYPTYDYTTMTSPITFLYSRVWWGEQGQEVASVSKLVGKLPAYAKMFRFTLVNTSGATVAVTSRPEDRNNNFTITDK